MDRKYYLAVDIGASSGRHMLSHLEDGKMVLEEIYRFPNGMTEKDGHKIWDVDQLFKEILAGMKKCALAGKITAWESTPGQWILFCWMPKIKGSGTQLRIVMEELRGWTRKFMNTFRKKCSIRKPEYKNRFLIRSIS